MCSFKITVYYKQVKGSKKQLPLSTRAYNKWFRYESRCPVVEPEKNIAKSTANREELYFKAEVEHIHK